VNALRRNRAGILIALLVLAVVVLVTVLTPRTTEEAFSPESVDPSGGRALAQVLAGQGVTISEERRFADVQPALGDDVTVLVTDPDLLSAARWRTLAASGADLVLLRPGQQALDALTSDVAPTGSATAADRDPGCSVADAVAAGPARAGGLTYAASGDATSCYGGSYVRSEQGGSTLTVIGQPSLMTNRWVDHEGNAALALRTLGAHAELVWYLPDPLDTEAPTLPLSALLPRWLWPAVALLAVAGVVVLLWRGRRLGPVVVEPLPVVVRAAETVEGHGRLYASARAVDRAAGSLREASLRRLRAATGLDPRASAGDVADQVAWFTGRPANAVLDLLAGAPPADDPGLVRLANELELLERHVREPLPRKAPQ
jgi:hypothetical protein